MAVQRAKAEVRYAKLSTEFGKTMAARWFTPAQLAEWPRLRAGKNKGELAGIIEWHKVTEGGWTRNLRGRGVGGVQYPGTRDVCLVRTEQQFGMTRERRLRSDGRVNHESRSESNTVKPEEGCGLKLT